MQTRDFTATASGGISGPIRYSGTVDKDGIACRICPVDPGGFYLCPCDVCEDSCPEELRDYRRKLHKKLLAEALDAYKEQKRIELLANK